MGGPVSPPPRTLHEPLVSRLSVEQVKLVYHARTQRTFAMKILQKAQIQQLRQQANIMNERDLMMRIDHPFILKLYDTYKDRDRLYVAAACPPCPMVSCCCWCWSCCFVCCCFLGGAVGGGRSGLLLELSLPGFFSNKLYKSTGYP